MPQVSFNRRTLLVAVAALAIAIVGVLQFAKLAEDRSLFRPNDFVEYWAAGRLLLDGDNPYDPDRLQPMQKSMYEGVIKAIMMWNPPWTLPVVMPFAALPWRLAQFLWLGAQLASLLVSVDLLWRIYGGPTRYRWVAWTVALTFAPSIFLLLLGQISALLLLGVVGYLWFIRRDRPIVAGCLLALTAIKPHHLALFALLIALQATRDRSVRKSIVTGVLVLLVCSCLPMIWNPNVWSDYLSALKRPTSDTFEGMAEFEHSTLGYYLRTSLPGAPFAAQFVPLIVAMIGVAIWWCCVRSWSWERPMPLLIALGMIVTPYGAWAFDMVLLLVTLVPMAVRVSATRSLWRIGGAIAIFVAINAATLETIRRAGSQDNPLIAPIVLAGYIANTILTHKMNRQSM